MPDTTTPPVVLDEKAKRASFFARYGLADLLTHIGTEDWTKMSAEDLASFHDDCVRLVNTGKKVATSFDETLKKAHAAGKLTSVPRFRTRVVTKDDDENKEVDITEMFEV